MKKVLIVEDEELMRSILRRLMEGEGFDVLTADSAENALEVLATTDIAVTITDIKMPGMDGIEFLDTIKSFDDQAMVIIITAFSSVDSAIAALRKGAYDYVTKPFVNEELITTVKNAIAQHMLFRENRALRRELARHSGYSEIIGRSESLNRVRTLIDKVADSDSTVLISGESGTGKELVARAIHFQSSRAERSFLAINCGALPETLLESELFGHVKGSFTGAVADRKGLLTSAEGGTIFLDEVGEMPAALQVKLLRALQEREVVPVGSVRPEPFDARIVAATNRDLEAEVALGNFREDLFYRLNVIEIPLPPLRERPGDIPLLARHFLAKTAREQGRVQKPIAESAMDCFKSYSWPGNVRELQNAIERAFLLSDDEITEDTLPAKIANHGGVVMKHDGDHPLSLEEVEKRYILDVISRTENDKVKAAKTLGIDLSTLYRKLKRFEET